MLNSKTHKTKINLSTQPTYPLICFTFLVNAFCTQFVVDELQYHHDYIRQQVGKGGGRVTRHFLLLKTKDETPENSILQKTLYSITPMSEPLETNFQEV